MTDALSDVLPFAVGPERREIKHRLAGKAAGPDGVWRDKAEEDELNRCFARLFKSPDGENALRYLKQITLARVCGPEATEAQLRHIEGQRFLVSVILNRIERGKRP